MGLVRMSNNTDEVLRDDVPQQCRLAGAGHTQHDRLHHTHAVGAVPRLTVNVVAEND